MEVQQGVQDPRGGGMQGVGGVTHTGQLLAPLVAQVISEAVQGRQGYGQGVKGGLFCPWASPSFFGLLRERSPSGGSSSRQAGLQGQQPCSRPCPRLPPYSEDGS